MRLQDFAKNNVLRDKETYIGYWFSCMFTVFVFFIFSVNQFHPELNKGPGAVATIMGSAQVIVILFSIFFLGLSIKSFSSKRESMFGILLMLGMTKKQLKKLLLLENILIGLTSIFVGIFLGIAFGHLLVLVMAKIINLSSISFYFPIKSIIITLIVFSIVFLLVTIVNSKSVLKKPIYYLINNNHNEYKKITYSNLLSIMSIVFIFIGYVLANIPLINRLINNKSDFLNIIQNSDKLHYFIGLTVVIGMYLFFSNYSKYFLDKLKSKQNYFKGTNVLWISELKYRLSSNSKTMFISALLLTVAFVTIIGTITLNSTADDEVSKTTPFDLAYFSILPNEEEESDINFINNNLSKSNINYNVSTINILRNNEKEREIIISQEDYNNVSNDKIHLSNNDAIKLAEENFKGLISLDDKIEINIIDNRPNVFDSYRYRAVYVVSDELFNNLSKIFKHSQRAFLYHFLENTTNDQARKVASINRSTLVSGYSEGNNFLLIQKIERIDLEKYTYQVLTYIGIMLSIIFILAAGSLTYFRLLSNIRGSDKTYINIYKIGLSIREIQSIQSKQFKILFFAPVIFSLINTIFAINILSYVLKTSIWKQTIIIALLLLIIQIIYFNIINSHFKLKIELIITQN